MKTGRIVVITGAAGGMGKLADQRFLANGDPVIATDTQGEALEALVQGERANARLHTIIGDITGPFLMIKAIAPLLRGRAWGRIVTMGSASTFEGVADLVHHVAAKAGLFGLSRSLARVLGKDGITVNVVTPGLTVTPQVQAHIPPELIEQQIKVRALPREERGEDLIGAIFFLASPDADFITGQTVNVDSGKYML